MNHYPKELKYSQTHEWVRLENDDLTVVVGITEHAQSQLGEIVFVQLPEVEDKPAVHAGDEVGVIESVKAAADVYSPVSGTVIAVNEDLNDAPGMLNTDPFGDGWLYKLTLQDRREYDELLDCDSYQVLITEEEEQEE